MIDRPLSTIVCSYQIGPADIAELLANYGLRLGLHFQGVIIVNGDHDIEDVGEDWVLVKGSNSEFEFSAYQEGIEALEQSSESTHNIVLFLNDTAFQKHHGFHIVRNLLPYINPVADCSLPAMAGKADHYNNICYRSPWSGLPIYLTTFCFLLNRPALPFIKSVIECVDKDLGDKRIDLDDPAWGCGLDKTFRAYLRCHLSYSGISNSWYQLLDKRDNRRLIGQKARCVYYEHRLSGEIGVHGVLFNIYPTLIKKCFFFLREQQAKAKRRLFCLWQGSSHDA